jgi:Fe-S-cluster containining protein
MTNFPVPAHLCSICRSPGACCKNFVLNKDFWDDEDIHEQWAHVVANAGANGELSQFVPIRKFEGDSKKLSGRSYNQWRFMCKALLPNGRCGMYENRPHPCREYKAGSDRLCVMFVPKE